MRVIFAIRGKRGIAAMLGFIQALVWIFAVANAVKHLDSILHVIGYAGGYATGTFVGVTIEQAIAYGVATVRIVTKNAGREIADALRKRGYGVTEFPGSAATARSRSSTRSCSAATDRRTEHREGGTRTRSSRSRSRRSSSGGIIASREWPVGGRMARWIRGRSAPDHFSVSVVRPATAAP